ncbi:MAG: class I SAM-dependent methyltransferase [bacterium]|nr:class I SAM-dependent methyltransferase [bacterium]
MNEQTNGIQTIKNIYNCQARWYDFLVKPVEFFLLHKKRRELFSKISGRVLEVGIGTGANFPYYRSDIVLTGIDASPEMLKIAEHKANKRGLSVDFREMDAENLEFPDGYFDVVVSTLTLCTIPHPVKAAIEMARVCKKGGRVLFLEHGKSDIGWISRWQIRKSDKHFQKHSCRLLSEPLNIIASAGLSVKTSKKFFLGIFQQIEATA